jgi:hypothetical protein
MKWLELFSGIKSVGQVTEHFGYEVVSLDHTYADLKCNIVVWNYSLYEPDYFDVIWASAP